ncbi:metal-sensing transcriptional repressor [Megasphaera paucivorans]|uniref:DNA-binding transcriptional regulator, FrmR family n=1 Tax=Megasphaera paucivorans TaxID=349095 RepID=A0A1H0BDX2_9FIRM|nr:metal-sensing transcriptional repressor [Megasphaera paucivorans]SDN43801.1 DNA-binding transcriptional regulator, FrmR family [Megasphaera paucivorans]
MLKSEEVMLMHGQIHYHTQIKVITNRLAKIGGHVESIKHMVEDGRDCSEILIQLSAVNSAIISVGKVVLKDHMDHCIVDAVHKNDIKAIDRLNRALDMFIR